MLVEKDKELPEQWSSERIRNLVPPERKEFYETQYPIEKINECYTMIVGLQNLIQDKKWPLTLEFRNYYCAFYFGDSRVFGVNLYSSPRFAVWITKSEAERLRNYCKFDHYATPHRHAVYPRNTTVDSLRPIFEFAYKKHQNIDVVSQ